MTTTKPALWTPGDWNALFGLGTNVLVNLLVMTGLLKFVLQMPDEITFGRIIPAVGLMLFLGNAYYAYMAWKLARETGRADVCALPSGQTPSNKGLCARISISARPNSRLLPASTLPPNCAHIVC